MSHAPDEIPVDENARRLLSGDPESVASLYLSDAILLPPNDTTVYGTEEIRWWWDDYFKYFKIVSTAQTEHDLVVNRDQAFERTGSSITIVPKEGGPDIVDEIRILTVWRRNPAGEWKISHQMWNSVKPVGAGTNRYMSRMIRKKRESSS